MSHNSEDSGRDGAESDTESVFTAVKARERFAERLEEAGLDAGRFIPVQDGEKGTRMNGHQQPENWLSADASRLNGGNYGVHPGLGEADSDWWLVEFDNDDYDDETDTSAVDALPATFEVESPHTDADSPGHQYYRANVETIAVVEELNGNLNPEPEWGEIKIEGKYVVGPGSQLDGCTKDWCDECEKSDGGYYRIANDRPIATISPNDMRAVLSAESATNADLPTGDDDGDDDEYDGPELSEEQVEDALDHVDSNLRYEDWIRMGFAVHDWDDGATGKRVFGKWSRSNPKWDAERGQRHIEDIWTNGSQADGSNSSVSVGTLVHRAQQRGWDGPGGGLIGAPSPDGVVEDDAENVDLPKPSPSAGFECRNGHYGFVKQENGEDVWVTGTNFQLETRSFIIEDGGATVTVELTVHPASDEHGFDVTVPIDVFTEPRKFRQKVATGRTTTYDLGTQFLNKIRQFVGGQDAPVRTPTRQIGLHGTELVTPDGVLTAGGWTDDPDTLLVDNDTTVPQKWQLDAEDGTDYDRDAVREILETFPQTRENDRFLPALGWFYAASIRPKIMEWTGEFNVLNITGDTGAGKNGTIEVLWELFGMGGEPLSIEGTAFTRLTAFSSSNSIPVWFDEFKPAEIPDHEVDRFMSLLRKSTRGGTEPKGNADQTEDQWHLRAPIVVTGEQLVSGPAEERRAIQTVFSSAVTDEGTEEYRQYEQLTGGSYVDENGETVYCDRLPLMDHARAYYPWLLERIEDDTLEREWNRAGERVTDLLAEEGVSVHPTVKQGFQTILFGCRLYRGFCDAVGADADAAGVTDEAAINAILNTADTGTGHEHVSHLDRLLGLAARASAADYLEQGEHYKLVVPRDATEKDEELRLKLSTAFDEIRRYARDHDIKDGDLLDAARDYRVRIQDGEEAADSVVVKSSVKTYGLDRTCAFSVAQASDHIDDFERSMFDPEDNAQQEDGDDTHDRSSPPSIDALEPGDRTSLTVCTAGIVQNPPQWVDGKGTFRFAEGEKISYHAQGIIPELDVGCEYELTDAIVTTTTDGETILELRAGMTEIAPVEGDADEGEEASDDGTAERTATGTGEPPLVDMHGMSEEEKEPVKEIDRTTQFGNPFKLKRDGGEHTLDESIRRYTVWFNDKLDRDPEFRAAVDELAGEETLGCWCVDSKEACHGEVILDYLDSDDTESATEEIEVGEPPADAEGTTADAARVLHALRMMETDGAVGRPELAVELDSEMSPDQVEASIEKLLQRGDITEPERNHYRPT